MESWGASRLQTDQILTMACSVITTVFVSLGVYLLLHQPCTQAAAPSNLMAPSDTSRHRAGPQYLRARLEPLVGDVLIDDTDDLLDVGKRQFDDYGHMRFGKRGDPEDKFDDYGHMRFGRGHL